LPPATMHPRRAPIPRRTQTVFPPTLLWVDVDEGLVDEHGGRFTKTVEVRPPGDSPMDSVLAKESVCGTRRLDKLPVNQVLPSTGFFHANLLQYSSRRLVAY